MYVLPNLSNFEASRLGRQGFELVKQNNLAKTESQGQICTRDDGGGIISFIIKNSDRKDTGIIASVIFVC